ncbi:MAG: hypothetical protein ACK5Q5_22930 [Planctomycetaceae bacterium]
MTDSVPANAVWLRPLGAAWKVRVRSAEAAETLRSFLTSDGWKCTTVTPAFDQPQTVLFRASDLGGDRDRDLTRSVSRVAALALQPDLA